MESFNIKTPDAKKVICNLCSSDFSSGGSDEKVFVFFFGYGMVTFSFYFLIFCVCEVSLFSLNNGIQSIALVF